jgi:hypothetical protein
MLAIDNNAECNLVTAESAWVSYKTMLRYVYVV